MHETVEHDPISGEAVKVWTGRGTVASVSGVGPAIGDGWLYYLVEIHTCSDSGEHRALASVVTAVVAVTDPVYLRAVDVVAFADECAWRIEHRRLPHIPVDRPDADLKHGVDTAAVLVDLTDAEPQAVGLHLVDAIAGEDL